MPQPTSTRLHPIAAIRAMRNLTRDREDMRQGFLLMDALRGKTTLRQFARFRQTETGRTVLAERRQLRYSNRDVAPIECRGWGVPNICEGDAKSFIEFPRRPMPPPARRIAFPPAATPNIGRSSSPPACSRSPRLWR